MLKRLTGIIFLAATLWLICTNAKAASKFLVLCTTSCTWDNTNDAIWSTSSGGANNTTHPTSADQATLDASSCVGGLTCTITVAADLSLQSLTMGACTGTTTGCIIDFSVNNNNVTLSGNSGISFSGTGTGTRNLKMGNGVWTLTSTATVWNMTTTTNLTFAANSSTIVINNTSINSKTFVGGALTYNAVSISAGTLATLGVVSFNSANSFSSVTIANPNYVTFPSSATNTITTLTLNGTVASPITFTAGSPNTTGTLALTSATIAGAAIRDFTFTGSPTATSSFDLGHNSGITITAPATGGGSRCIGC